MTASNAIQTPLEHPSEDFRKAVHVCSRGGDPPPNASVPQCLNASSAAPTAYSLQPSVSLPGGVKVFASRDGDHVTGRVQFPYPVAGRTSVPIDYHNQSVTRSEAKGLDSKALARHAMVLIWRSLCDADKSLTRLDHAKRVCADAHTSRDRKGAEFRCSPRSLQLWSRKLDTEGPAGLADRYEPPPRKVLSLDSNLASDAVSICAWWAFRIGNQDVIDSKMVHSAALIRPRAEYMRDIIAAIEAYYSWPTDRLVAYPFKSFARWAKYDFDKWLYRALSPSIGSEPGRSEPEAQAPGNVPLQPPLTVIPRHETFPDSKTRKREVNHHGTRRAIAALAPPSSEPGAPAERTALATGLPDTIPDFLLALDVHKRWMLIRAAQGDAAARKQALVTMPLWWERVPDRILLFIEAKASAWEADHRVSKSAIAGRKLAMLLPLIRNPRRGRKTDPKSACELLETLV